MSARALAGLLLIGAAARAAAGDLAPWEEILRARVTAEGEVAYRTLANADGARLERFLRSMADAEPNQMSRDAAVAFWINSYHALIVFGVLQGADPATLPGRARLYHWFQLEIAGAERSADDLEQILDGYARGDPRIHLAVSNGTRGGPPLSRTAYSAGTLDAQLARAARRFINDRRWNRMDLPSRHAELSPIFSWHRSDFEQAPGSLLGFVSRFVVSPKAAGILRRPEMTSSFAGYDWSLNAAPGESPF